jgi:hypothetical protein
MPRSRSPGDTCSLVAPRTTLPDSGASSPGWLPLPLRFVSTCSSKTVPVPAEGGNANIRQVHRSGSNCTLDVCGNFSNMEADFIGRPTLIRSQFFCIHHRDANISESSPKNTWRVRVEGRFREKKLHKKKTTQRAFCKLRWQDAEG